MIRAATPADAAGIAAIWNAAIRDTIVTFNPVEKPGAEIAALTLTTDPFFVWERDNHILGFSRYFPFRSGLGYVHTVEHTIMLAAGAQGRGVGRSMMTHLTDHAARAGKHSMIAVVSHENAAGLAFHTACGFVTVATLPQVGFKFGRWHDAVFMQKRL